MGGVHFAQGDFSRALEDFRKALALDPRDVRACNNLATALERLGDYAGAQEAYGRAVLIDPSYPVHPAQPRHPAVAAAGEPGRGPERLAALSRTGPDRPYADEVRGELALLPELRPAATKPPPRRLSSISPPPRSRTPRSQRPRSPRVDTRAATLVPFFTDAIMTSGCR